MTVEAMPAEKPPHPLAFDVDYPQQLSRLTTFFRLILAIPQLIVVYLLLIALGALTILAWFAILFTGRYPKAFFDFTSGVFRWMANLVAYLALFRDEYPPFSWQPGAYPVNLELERPERQSRWRLFIRAFAIIPNQIVFAFVLLAWYITSFIAWFAILFTGRYPRGLFGFGAGAMRWQLRQAAYAYLLRDEYPPYSTDSDARPGNELVSAIIGFPIFALYVFFYVMTLPFGVFGGETETVTVQTPLSRLAFAAQAPTGEANGMRLTLLDYNDNVPAPLDAERLSDYRFVAFRLRAEKDGLFPTFFTPFLLEVRDCLGFDYPAEDASSGFEFAFFWRGGEKEGTAVFQVPSDRSVCELVYQPGFGEIEFRFVGGP